MFSTRYKRVLTEIGDNMTIDERKRLILESIIKDYVETAEPVGSRAIVRKHALNISAATVRNEMADLEEMGFLEQRHTSSGRIPSELGFRYYVDCMMEKEKPADEDLDVFKTLLNDEIREWKDAIQGVGQFLSQMTNYTSFIIVPSIKFSHFKSLQLIPIQEGQALLLLITDSGIIMHKKIEIPTNITPIDLQFIGTMFNRVFMDKKLEEIHKSDLKILRDDLKKRRKVIDKALDTIDDLLDSSSNEKILINGALNILNEPEFKDLDKLKRILTILEEDVLLKEIIPDKLSEDVDITIGKENQMEDVKELSLVCTGYNTAGRMGKIGLIGPVRMEYWKAAGSVESVKVIIEEILKEYFS